LRSVIILGWTHGDYFLSFDPKCGHDASACVRRSAATSRILLTSVIGSIGLGEMSLETARQNLVAIVPTNVCRALVQAGIKVPPLVAVRSAFGSHTVFEGFDAPWLDSEFRKSSGLWANRALDR
jgi:hypothetical protein